MPAFNAESIAEVKQACEATALEAADAMSRSFDQKISIEVGEGSNFDASADLGSLAEPGLAIVLKVEDQAAILPIPASAGILPDWYTEPDPTGESKLATLGQELGMTLLPEEFMAMEFQVAAIGNLAAGVTAGEVGENPGKLALTLNGEQGQYVGSLIWPIKNADAVFEAKDEAPAAAPAANSSESPAPAGKSRIDSMDQLPSYTRSLLRISVPMKVILASKTMKVNEIVSIGTGTIIQFDKSCEDTLDVEINNQKVAEGEAVKIGDKFGIRVTGMKMPEERYIALKAKRRVR